MEFRTDLSGNDLQVIEIHDSFSGGYFSGSGITKTGPGVLELHNSISSYTAPFVVEEGELVLSHSGALSASSEGLTIKPGATVRVDEQISLADRKVDLQGTLLLDDQSAWDFDEGLTLTGDSVKILSEGNTSSLVGGGTAIPLTGKKLVLSAGTLRLLKLEKDIEVDPEGGVFELELGSASEGEAGAVYLSTAVRQRPGSTGSFGAF